MLVCYYFSIAKIVDASLYIQQTCAPLAVLKSLISSTLKSLRKLRECGFFN